MMYGVNGTAHAAGTAHYNHLVGHAYAEGNWGTKTGGTTLVGELGRELVVDPGSGTWHTVGDNGAEFTDIPAGSIVFNHKQTEALLERGFVAGRGTARVNGTAMVRGGISVKQANIASGKTTYSGKPSKTKSSTGKSSSGNSGKSKSSSSSKDSEQDIDYIEIKFKRLERVISNFGKIASDTFRSLENRLDHLTKVAGNKKYDSELELLKSEKNTATKAVSYYLKKAKGVNLDEATKKKIRSGDIDYRTYSSKNDEKYKNIKKYQTFYEKSLDARDKQLEIEENIAKLFSDRFDMISTDFDNDKAIIEHRTNTANNNIDSGFLPHIYVFQSQSCPVESLETLSFYYVHH